MHGRIRSRWELTRRCSNHSIVGDALIKPYTSLRISITWQRTIPRINPYSVRVATKEKTPDVDRFIRKRQIKMFLNYPGSLMRGRRSVLTSAIPIRWTTLALAEASPSSCDHLSDRSTMTPPGRAQLPIPSRPTGTGTGTPGIDRSKATNCGGLLLGTRGRLQDL